VLASLYPACPLLRATLTVRASAFSSLELAPLHARTHLRVLRDILREKGIPHTVYGDRHSSLRRNDKHWTLEEELAGRQEPTQVGRVLANLGVEVRYALSAPAKGRVERLWGVLQDRLISELRLAGASTRGQAQPSA